MPKQRTLKRIDSEPKQHIGGGEIITSAEAIAPPIPAAIPEPRNLTATQGPIAQSAVTPSAYIDLEWESPITALDGLRYIIEYDTSSAFTSPQRQNTANLSARLTLPTRGASGITYYFRIATLYNSYQQSDWSDTASATTASDTAAPTPPTGVTAAYIGQGDLRILWAKSTSDNLRDTLINIYDSASKTTLYETVAVDGEEYIWTVAQNRNRTSNVPRTSVYVELQSRSWGGTLSTAASATATSAAPSAPTVSVDFTGPDAIYTLSYGVDVASLSFVPDTSVAARVIAPTTRYVYTFANNAADHSGVADPVLAYSFTATNGLGQFSTATTGTATNAAPSAPSSVSVSGFLGTMSISVSATQPSDFKTFRVRIIQTLPSASDVIFDSANTLITRSIDTLATYQVAVRVVDAFNQTSTETLSSATVIDALSIAQLRSDTLYSDAGEHTSAELNVLKDAVSTTGGVAYSGSDVNHIITAARPTLDRCKSISIGYTATAAVGIFVGVSSDDVNYLWFATTNPLTSRPSQSDAAANAFIMPSGTQTYRLDLPTPLECRFVKLGIFSGSAFTLHEFYPRRFIQSDDIEAEGIRAVNIAAGAVTAAKLSVAQLSAITADMGTLTAGTITGATVQTAASGARTVLNSTGLTTYNSSGVAQVTAGTGSNGALTAGAGAVKLDASGMTIICGTSQVPTSKIKLTDGTTRELGFLTAYYGSATFESVTTIQSNKRTESGAGADTGGTAELIGQGDTDDALIRVTGNSYSGSPGLTINSSILLGAQNINIVSSQFSSNHIRISTSGGFAPPANGAVTYSDVSSSITSLTNKFPNNASCGAKSNGRLFAIATTASDNTSSSASAGGASALPSFPVGYFLFEINGTTRKIPYYA